MYGYVWSTVQLVARSNILYRRRENNINYHNARFLRNKTRTYNNWKVYTSSSTRQEKSFSCQQFVDIILLYTVWSECRVTKMMEITYEYWIESSLFLWYDILITLRTCARDFKLVVLCNNAIDTLRRHTGIMLDGKYLFFSEANVISNNIHNYYYYYYPIVNIFLIYSIILRNVHKSMDWSWTLLFLSPRGE